MAYRLSPADPVPKALRSTALEVLDDAVARARDGLAADPVTSVHEIRKDIKKLRSLLRLARPGMPSQAFRRENRTLRDTARTIAGVRDADVLAETVDQLAERYAGRLPKRAFTGLRPERTGEIDDPGALVAALEQARARAMRWPLDRCDTATLRAGAARAYARGRAALAAAEREPSAERLHEWRKRVKDLWYHQRLLRDAWPEPLKAMADESHRLSDLLGDDHDLAVLAERVDDEPAILTLIAERRAELQGEALRLGRCVYAEKPKAYGRRLGAYLSPARAGRPRSSARRSRTR